MDFLELVSAGLSLWVDDLTHNNALKRQEAWLEVEQARKQPGQVPLLVLAASGLGTSPLNVLNQVEQSASARLKAQVRQKLYNPSAMVGRAS